MSNPAVLRNSVCAVIVTYFPELNLTELVQQLLPQVAKIFIIDNTPQSTIHRCLTAFQDMPEVVIKKNKTNLGIATALNQGLEFASNGSYQWILTLDQDSRCEPELVNTLLQVAMTCSPQPMIVGSNYFDPRSKQTKVRTGEAATFLEQKTVITSGSLVDVLLATAIGRFREDYFIDQVDHEFCLRARAHGHTVVISRKPLLIHSVGLSGGVRLPFLGVLPNHAPLRKYYIARNTVVTIATYWRHEPEWCLRRLVRMVLGLAEMAILERHRFLKIRAFAEGVTDGMHRSMGPCQRRWLTNQR